MTNSAWPRSIANRHGNVVAMVFAGVAMVGVLSVSVSNLVVGPVSTAAKVTQHNIVLTDLLTNAKVVTMNAATRPQMGDEDGDGYVEPVPFIPVTEPSCGISLSAGGEGGCLPTDIGAILTDPWGTSYAYCVWDHGETHSSENRIDGEDSTSGAVLAIISAGPNKRFETPCLPYDGDPDTIDPGVNPNGEGDDSVQIFTYAAAVAGSGGLWELKENEPTTAAINKDIEVDGAFRMGFAGESDGQVGLSACTDVNHIGRMRFNPIDNAIEVCAHDGSGYGWDTMSGGGVTQVQGNDIALADSGISGGNGSCMADGVKYDRGTIVWSIHHLAHLYCSRIMGQTQGWRYLGEWQLKSSVYGELDVVFPDGFIDIADGYALKYDGQKFLWGNDPKSSIFLGFGAGRQNMGIGPEDNVSQATIIGDGASMGASNRHTQTVVGYHAGWSNSGQNQTAVGNGAGSNNSGHGQTAVGYSAGSSNKGQPQTAVGKSAGSLNQGSSQTAVGDSAGNKNTGARQVAIGSHAGYENTGSDQTAIGYYAGRLNTKSGQTVVGSGAGENNQGQYQTAIGYQAGQNNSGNNQTVLGRYAGKGNTTGTQTAIGFEAGYENTAAFQTAVGSSAGKKNSGLNQVAIGSGASPYPGWAAGTENTGESQTVVGASAGYQNTGAGQAALGTKAGYQNSGIRQTAFGELAGYQNTGDYQTAIGRMSGYQNTGHDLTALGLQAGYKNTGNQVVAIGRNAAFQNTLDNQFIVKVSTANETPLLQGNFATLNLGVGLTAPKSRLHVNGAIQIGTASNCDGDRAGAIRYENQAIELCDGFGWSALGGSVDHLKDIGDVDITEDPASGYMLVWNDTTKKWQAQNPTSLVIGGSGTAKKLEDTDKDTGIQVENTEDDDTIRFSTAGAERVSINPDGTLDLIGNRIRNLGDPVNEQDAATKAYVDANTSGGSDNLGNHTATQDLDMAGFAVKDTTTIKFRGVSAPEPVSTGDGNGSGSSDGSGFNLNCPDGEIPVSNGSDWMCGVEGMGDHEARKTIILGSHWVSGDGGDEGLRIDATGNVVASGKIRFTPTAGLEAPVFP